MVNKTVILRTEHIKRGVWQIKDTSTGEYIGEERPYRYTSRPAALEAMRAMYPLNSVWQGHRSRGGYAILVDRPN